MLILRSIVLFLLAALCEIGGAWLIWQGVREHRGWLWMVGGVLALGAYGFVATTQPDAHFGRILVAYGGIFVAGSLAWGVALDGYSPDRSDLLGALIRLVGVAIIMYAPQRALSTAGCPLRRPRERNGTSRFGISPVEGSHGHVPG